MSEGESDAAREELRRAEDSALRLLTGQWDLSDFLEQLRSLKRRDIDALMGAIPGMRQARPLEARELVRLEAILLSMTPHERAHPECLDRPRLRRIALGSGTSEFAVRRLIKQFESSKRAIRRVVGDGPGRPG